MLQSHKKKKKDANLITNTSRKSTECVSYNTANHHPKAQGTSYFCSVTYRRAEQKNVNHLLEILSGKPECF